MKLNGLTNNLKDDKSLSNSYLQHIVELLRKELDSLQIAHNDLEDKFNEHEETQKIIVETKEVKADDVKSASIHTDVIEVTKIENGDSEINLLESAIEMFGNLKVNGHNVITDESFTGPFTYKGRVPELPALPVVGDVYAVDNTIYVWNGTSYDIFDIPVGAVSKVEYDEDRAEILTDIADIKEDVRETNAEVDIVKEDVLQLATTVGSEISKINETLENKVDEAPKDDNSYVRKNGEWIEQSKAENTVKEVAGDSKISNTEEGVVIEAPKVEINSEDIKVNGTTLTQADKFALTKTQTTGEVKTWYERKFIQKPFGSGTSDVYTNCSYNTTDRFCQKNCLNQMYFVATRDYQYLKYSDDTLWRDGYMWGIVSMDKDGNHKNLTTAGQAMNEYTLYNAQQANMVVWNPQYAPEGLENAMYMMYFGNHTSVSTDGPKYCSLFEYNNGDFVKSYNLTDQLGDDYKALTTLAYKSDYWPMFGVGGKSLRNKNVQRICFVSHDVRNGGTFAVIVGGNKDSALTDPFDASKAIYVKLPAEATGGCINMAATDSAWYLTEKSTGRIMRITPNGRVTEYNLSTTYIVNAYNYIEYTDKNNRAAAAYFFEVDATNGKRAVVFLEEKDDGGLNFVEKDMAPFVYGGWAGSLFRFMENDHYVFWTSSCGWNTGYAENSFDSADNHKKLFYWDKKTLTTHVIDDFYETEATWTLGSRIDMVKTRNNAIWFVPAWDAQSDAQRTGIIKYVSNIDYTDIDEETMTDKGHIEVQTANIGADYPWFIYNGTYGYNSYAYCLESTSSYAYSSYPNKMYAVNDDGILCIISSDCKAFALCYGDGNIKVYPVGPAGKVYNTWNPDVQTLMPVHCNTNAYSTMCVLPMKHGWTFLMECWDTRTVREKRLREAFTYIGLIYKNGEPTILERPVFSYSVLEQMDDQTVKSWWDYYGYNLTYDDYERRKLVLRGIRKDFKWCTYNIGVDGAWKEVEHNSKPKINLEYDGKVISSVEE